MNDKPIAAGTSSFELIDPTLLFDELKLEKGSRFLDLACGLGKYSIFASQYIDREGVIYAVDLWEEGIKELEKEIYAGQIENIKTIITDISLNIPIENGSIDTCLMATVVHDLVYDKTEAGTLEQVKKVMRNDGVLAVLEFKKINPPPGPPLEIRLTPDQLDSIVGPYGFIRNRTTDFGNYTYLSLYRKKDGI
jgi:ubiquinone/menaquinone biosynthesis C-methylase UbiE